jgi:hypothetical protein
MNKDSLVQSVVCTAVFAVIFEVGGGMRWWQIDANSTTKRTEGSGSARGPLGAYNGCDSGKLEF